MIYKLLVNFNNFLLYFAAFFMICLLLYVIYKIFIIENDIYLLNDKVNKIEVEYSGGSSFEKPSIKVNKNQISEQDRNYDINMNEIIMSNIFENDDFSKQHQTPKKPVITEIDIIDIDKVDAKVSDLDLREPSEPIFDLKKDVISDDKESVISINSSSKKKLLKLNLERLKEKCNEQGLMSSGTKAQLIERLLEKEQSDSQQPQQVSQVPQSEKIEE